MLELLRRCIDLDEREAWSDLFSLLEQVVTPPVRVVLWRAGFARMEAEYVVLELFEALYADDCRRLRSCGAQDEAGFRAWSWKVASHFAMNWVDRHRRFVARELAALSTVGMSDRSGPDERALQACLAEWEPLMRPDDFHRLLDLIGAAPATAVCERTRRRWTKQLMGKYPHLFGRAG